MTKSKERLPPLERARRAWQRALSIMKKLPDFETIEDIATALAVTRQAMWKWEVIPPARVHKVSELTGMPPHVLRPDLTTLFPNPTKEK